MGVPAKLTQPLQIKLTQPLQIHPSLESPLKHSLLVPFLQTTAPTLQHHLPINGVALLVLKLVLENLLSAAYRRVTMSVSMVWCANGKEEVSTPSYTV